MDLENKTSRLQSAVLDIHLVYSLRQRQHLFPPILPQSHQESEIKRSENSGSEQ